MKANQEWVEEEWVEAEEWECHHKVCQEAWEVKEECLEWTHK